MHFLPRETEQIMGWLGLFTLVSTTFVEPVPSLEVWHVQKKPGILIFRGYFENKYCFFITVRNPNSGLDSNNCRNPNGVLSRPFCFVLKYGLRDWRYCDVPRCHQSITTSKTIPPSTTRITAPAQPPTTTTTKTGTGERMECIDLNEIKNQDRHRSTPLLMRVICNSKCRIDR